MHDEGDLRHGLGSGCVVYKTTAPFEVIDHDMCLFPACFREVVMVILLHDPPSQQKKLEASGEARFKFTAAEALPSGVGWLSFGCSGTLRWVFASVQEIDKNAEAPGHDTEILRQLIEVLRSLQKSCGDGP